MLLVGSGRLLCCVICAFSMVAGARSHGFACNHFEFKRSPPRCGDISRCNGSIYRKKHCCTARHWCDEHVEQWVWNAMSTVDTAQRVVY